MGLAAITCLIAASSASALKVKYVAENDTLLPDSIGFVEASCPSGYKLTGGGAFSNGAFGTTKLQGSYPVDGDDQNGKADDTWRAVVWNTGAVGRKHREPGHLREGQARVPLADLLHRRLGPPRVKCPKGTKPTGGGMETGGTFTHPVDILSSRPSDGEDENSKPEAWFANASPPGMAVPFGETYVICAEPGEIKPTYRTDSFTVDDESQSSGVVPCRPDERLIGLGGATNATSSAITTIFGDDSKKDSNTKLDDGTFGDRRQLQPDARHLAGGVRGLREVAPGRESRYFPDRGTESSRSGDSDGATSLRREMRSV